MNKSLIFSVLLINLLITSAYAQDKKVAVVTFYAVNQIGLPDFGSVAAAARLASDPDFNLRPMLKKFHDQFFGDYSKGFPFQFLPESEVFNNEAYKTFIPEQGKVSVSDMLKSSGYTAIKGYQVVLPVKGDSNEKNLLKMFDQCDGIMEVYVNFDLEAKGFGGMGLVKVDAHATIVLFNKNGDKVFSINEHALSKNEGALIAGLPSITPKKILPLCESALDELIPVLQNDMPKMVKKANAKL